MDTIVYSKYLTLVEVEYRNIYHKGKWSAATSDLASGFYVDLLASSVAKEVSNDVG